MDDIQEARLQRAAERLLELLGLLLENMTPEQLDLRTVRSVSSTLKDIRELQSRKEQDAGKITVVLEGGAESYAQ